MIFTYAIAPYEDWHQQAWAAGFVLLTLVLVVNIHGPRDHRQGNTRRKVKP